MTARVPETDVKRKKPRIARGYRKFRGVQIYYDVGLLFWLLRLSS